LPHPGLPIEIQGERGRTELFSTAFSTYERQIRQQFTDMFSRFGFDARRDIAGIILNRLWARLLEPTARVFLRGRRQSGTEQYSARRALWTNRIRQHGSRRHHGSSLFDTRSPSRG